MQYTIYYGNTLSELITNVNKAIEAGYKPLGGVSQSETGYIQAMVKRDAT